MKAEVEAFRAELSEFVRQLKASKGKANRANVALCKRVICSLQVAAEQDGATGTQSSFKLLLDEFPWRAEIEAKSNIRAFPTVPEVHRLRLAYFWDWLGKPERMKSGPHSLTADDARRKFVTLAKEIIARIQNSRSDHWWKDVEQFTWTLEEFRLDLPAFDDWKLHLSDWKFLHDLFPDCAALLIVTQTKNDDPPPVASGYAQFARLKPEHKLSQVVTMVYSNPYKSPSEGSRHLMHVRDETEMIFSGQDEAKADAVACLESWVRVAEAMQLSKAVPHEGSVTEPADKSNPLPLGIERCDVPRWFMRSGYSEQVEIPYGYTSYWEALLHAWPHAVAATKREHLRQNGCDTTNAPKELRKIIDDIGLTISDWTLKELEI